MFQCEACGEQNLDDAKFCEFCGARLTSVQPPQVQPPPPPPTHLPPEPAHAAAQAAPPRKAQSISTMGWFLTLFISFLPPVNLLFLCFWAVLGKNTDRKHYSRAMLLIWALALAYLIVQHAERPY